MSHMCSFRCNGLFVCGVLYDRWYAAVSRAAHIRISHVTCEWVMSHACSSVLIDMTYGIQQCYRERTYQWVVLPVNESYHVWMSRMSHVTYEWVMAHMNESYYVWMSRTKLGEPYVYLKPVEQTLYSTTVPIKKSVNEWYYVWMSHVIRACVMSYMNAPWNIWMSHFTRE